MLGVGFKHFLIFTTNPGKIIQFDLRIFFRWVGENPPKPHGISPPSFASQSSKMPGFFQEASGFGVFFARFFRHPPKKMVGLVRESPQNAGWKFAVIYPKCLVAEVVFFFLTMEDFGP